MNPSLKYIPLVGIFFFLGTHAAPAADPRGGGALGLELRHLTLAPILLWEGAVEAELVHDFDGDGVNDLAIVILDPVPPVVEDDHFVERARTLVMGLRQGAGFRAIQSSGCVAMCTTCGGIMGDPFMGIKARGVRSLTVSNYGGSRERWSVVYTIAWRKEAFYVVGVDTMVFDSLRPRDEQKKSVNLLNGRYTTSGTKRAKKHSLRPTRIERCPMFDDLK
jgi:hypothetical protein